MHSIRSIALVIVSTLFVAMSASSFASARELSFDERVAAQRSIEEVYWRKRIWPEQNPGPKPALDHVLPADAIRVRVTDDLRKSNALERFWNQPITPQQLQAEMNRMARETRDPATLRELFAALGNDPTRIAETLARRSLADRLVRKRQAGDSRFAGSFDSWWKRESPDSNWPRRNPRSSTRYLRSQSP